jgi:hypothetical protein
MGKKLRLTSEELKHLRIKKVNVNNQYRLTEEQEKALFIFRGYDGNG